MNVFPSSGTRQTGTSFQDGGGRNKMVVMVVQEDSCRASAKRKDLSVDKQLGP